GVSHIRFPSRLLTTPPLWREEISTVLVPEQAKCFFTMKQTTPGAKELPAIMCTAEPPPSELSIIRFTLPVAWILRASANWRCTIGCQTHGQSSRQWAFRAITPLEA